MALVSRKEECWPGTWSQGTGDAMLSRLAAAVLAIWFVLTPVEAQTRSVLAPAPDWSTLEPFQQTITREEFVRLLEDVYAPRGAANGLIEITADSALIKTTLNPPAIW